MIARIWHGWTTPADADTYESLLQDEIFPGIFAKGVEGLESIDLLRRAAGDEVEFVTVMWFATPEALRAFAGEDEEAAYVPASARKVLRRFDQRSAHYQVRTRRRAPDQG